MNFDPVQEILCTAIAFLNVAWVSAQAFRFPAK
jgi:hypothetical protein